MNKWTLAFLVLSVGLLTAPAVTAISYGLPSAGNNDSIAEDGKKIKEKVKKVKGAKDKVEKKAAEAKKKWQKKDDSGSGNNDSSDSGDNGSDDSGSDDSNSGDSSGDDSSESSDEDSSDSSDNNSDSGDDSDNSSEEGSEEETEEEVIEEEVEETVEEPEEEVVEETVEEESVEEEPVEYPEGTFPDSHFADRPLERFRLQKYHITDPDGNRLMSVRSGEEVEIDYSFRNIQQKEQTYVMIAQIIDQQGVTIDMGWYIDTIQSGEYADWYGFWTPEAAGACTIKIMVWDSVDENPAPITKITEMTVLVH